MQSCRASNRLDPGCPSWRPARPDHCSTNFRSARCDSIRVFPLNFQGCHARSSVSHAVNNVPALGLARMLLFPALRRGVSGDAPPTWVAACRICGAVPGGDAWAGGPHCLDPDPTKVGCRSATTTLSFIWQRPGRHFKMRNETAESTYYHNDAAQALRLPPQNRRCEEPRPDLIGPVIHEKYLFRRAGPRLDLGQPSRGK